MMGSLRIIWLKKRENLNLDNFLHYLEIYQEHRIWFAQLN